MAIKQAVWVSDKKGDIVRKKIMIERNYRFFTIADLISYWNNNKIVVM